MFLTLFFLFNGLLNGLGLFVLNVYAFLVPKFTFGAAFSALFIFAGAEVFLRVKSLLKWSEFLKIRLFITPKF